VGPTLIFDHTERSGEENHHRRRLDRQPGRHPALASRERTSSGAAGLAARGRPAAATTARSAISRRPERNAANTVQQRYSPMSPPRWCCRCSRRATNPSCSCSGRATPMVRQHNQGDSLNELTAPVSTDRTSAAAIRNADDNLKQLQDALRELGLADDHRYRHRGGTIGFSTISKQSTYQPRPRRRTIRMFRKASCRPDSWRSTSRRVLGLPLFDPDNKNVRRTEERTTPRGNGTDRSPIPNKAGRGGRGQWRPPIWSCAGAGIGRAGATTWSIILWLAGLNVSGPVRRRTISATFRARCRCRRSI